MVIKMRANGIPEDIRDFILKYIDSVELLNVLMLFQANPNKEWSSQDIETTIRSSNASIQRRLQDLYARGVLIEKSPLKDRHAFTPKTEETADLINKVAAYNKLFPYRVIDLIYSRPAETLRSFADAFRIGKKEEK